MRPNCTCLNEIENNLPRTKHCLVACHAQREILRERSKEEVEKPKQTRILVVGTEGEIAAARIVQEVIQELQCKVEIISPERARELNLEANDSVIPIKNRFPTTYQYYPLSAVPKSRRERRANKRKK